MKQTLQMAVLASIMAVPAATHADYILENSPMCITHRTAQAYANNIEAGQAQFNSDLMDRAACFVQEDAAMVALTDTAKDFLQVQLPTGHKMWVANEFYKVGDLPLPEVTKSATDEEVTKKPTWVNWIKGYIDRK